MKIGSLPAVAMEQYNSSKIKAQRAAAARPETDRLEITGTSQLFAEALEEARQAPEVRLERVEDLRAQIAGGMYRIDSAAVAARILSGI